MKRGLVLPDYEYDDIVDIDDALLKGKNLIIFDVDNTLVFPETTTSKKKIIKWVRKRAKEYTCVCVSNSKTIATRARKIERLVGCKVIISRHKKPWNGLFRDIERVQPVVPKKTVLIGDRILTDILFGNAHGMTTILVKRFATREKVSTKILRAFEATIKWVCEAMEGKVNIEKKAQEEDA